MEREITKAQFERAVANGRVLTKPDKERIFSAAELCGYGVYISCLFHRDGKYYVLFSLGSTCD